MSVGTASVQAGLEVFENPSPQSCKAYEAGALPEEGLIRFMDKIMQHLVVLEPSRHYDYARLSVLKP